MSQGHEAMRAVVAIDRREIESAGQAFINDLWPFLAILAAVLLGGGWLQVTIGLKPLDTIRTRLAEVRSRRRTQLGTGFPTKCCPLPRRLICFSQRRKKRSNRRAPALRTWRTHCHSIDGAPRGCGNASLQGRR
jgi:hypothetical protein